MIYITLYGQTRCSKRRHSLAQLTQHMVYEAALTQKATIRVPRFSVSSHPPPPPAAVSTKSFSPWTQHGLSFELFLGALQLKWTQWRFTTCSNVTQDKKTTAAGY